MLRKLREARDEEGFTLIELLVVVIIIGILAAIAIPVFLNQREKAYSRSAESDARNAATAFESYFADANEYPATATEGPGPATVTIGNDQLVLSDEVTLDWTKDYSSAGTFCIEAYHSQIDLDGNGTGGENPADLIAVYKSDLGGFQETVAAC